MDGKKQCKQLKMKIYIPMGCGSSYMLIDGGLRPCWGMRGNYPNFEGIDRD
jgi:hypothetical protein